MSQTIGAEYAGVLKTRLVDRASLLDEVKAAIDDSPRSHVFYITGPGGMGKTVLLQEVLRNLCEEGVWHNPDIVTVTEPVDLFHSETHSSEGVMRAIRAELRPGMDYFQGYRKERDRLEQLKVYLAQPSDIEQQRQRVEEAFLVDFKQLSEKRRIVLAIDTAEVLLYEPDQVQQMLHLEEEGVGARDWLIRRFLPHVENTVVLLAGRPKPARLRQDLEEALGSRLRKKPLGPLSEEDSVSYFREAALVARENRQTRVAEQIERIPDEIRRVIYIYTGGRPILLSLVIDYLTLADRLLPDLTVPLASARAKTQEELDEIQQRLERDIVRAIQDTPRPADRVIMALGWARRGLDVELLMRLEGFDQPTAEALLAEVRRLSFVKVRPADQRLFLQDEMYNLLQRHVLRHLPPTRADEAYAKLVAYAVEKVRQARKALGEQEPLLMDTPPGDEHAPLHHEHERINAPTGDELIKVREALAEARQRLQNAIADEVHYRLRYDPIDGFENYLRYAEGAFQAHAESLDMQLRDELLQYLDQAEPEDKALIEDRATWDLAVRWVKRYIAKREYATAIETAGRLRTEAGTRMQALGLLADAELNILKGWALAYQGTNLDEAEMTLGRALEILKRSQPEPETIDNWQHDRLMANAYNLLGYVRRQRGRSQDAVRYYRGALPFWRALKNEQEHATTLNNLAMALAEVGDLNQALRYCSDGLAMRRRLGPRYPIALSLNTMGLIEVRYDHLHRAKEYCERALTIFTEMEQPRGVGLAGIAAAETLRRTAERAGIHTPYEQGGLLRDAEKYARTAVEIFSSKDDPKKKEQARLVEALIELGCVYRDWARLRPQYTWDDDPQALELEAQSEKVLRQAAAEAHVPVPFREVEARVNLAWLYFYKGERARAERMVHEEILPLISREYLIIEGSSVPHPDEPITFYWVQLGKTHILLGEIEAGAYSALYDKLKSVGSDTAPALKHLRQAAEEYTLALAYDELFASDFRDMERGLDRIYDTLKTLNPQELDVVSRAIRDTEQKYNLPPPSRMRTYFEESLGRGNLDI
ncbi:MAG: tetratricopeptide repeat protein [Anaerolineae bacterium]